VFALLALVLFALCVAAVVSALAFAFRMAFWMVLLPVRLLFGVLIVPFWIARMLLKVVFGALMLPVLLVVGGLLTMAALIAAFVAIVTPMLPLLIVGFLIWVVIRSLRRPAVVAYTSQG
jgi:hypothetical protein